MDNKPYGIEVADLSDRLISMSQELDTTVPAVVQIVQVYLDGNYHNVIGLQPREDNKTVILEIDPVGSPRAFYTQAEANT